MGRIGHHHADPPSELHILQVLDSREGARRVVPALRAGDPGCHVARPGEQSRHIDAGEDGRQQTYRTQHGEAPSHPRGQIEHRNVQRLPDLPQRAARRVGGEDQVLLDRAGSDDRLQPLPHHQISGHGLAGGARLGDHVDQGPLHIEAIEQSRRLVGVHVVEHVEARPMPAAGGAELVPVEGQQSRRQSRRPEGRTPDAYHHQAVVLAVVLRSEAEQVLRASVR